MLAYQRSPQWPYKVSAGGAVYRVNEQGEREYALLYRSKESHGEYGDSYHLPKGTVEVGETLQQAATREITEESGFEVELVHFLTGATLYLGEDDSASYPFTMTVIYFLARYQRENTEGMDGEHDEVQWKSPSEAQELLKQIPKQEERIIELAEEYFKKVDDDAPSQ